MSALLRRVQWNAWQIHTFESSHRSRIDIAADITGVLLLAPNPPPELWSRLFHAPATEVLVEAISEHRAQLVLTTSWLRFLPREGFEQLFAKTGLEVLATSLHDAWEAPQNRGETRAEAIDRWLAAHHRGEPYLILDDELSGTGLRHSVHDKLGRLVLCKERVGLLREHMAAIRSSLSRPCEPFLAR